MRLAFAVAINVDADVLLIDEILAVGDVAFQKKCFEKLKEIKAKGTTIVIVSHSMDQMYRICDRLIWIEKGLIKNEGVPKFIGEEYLAEMEGRRLSRIEEEKAQKQAEIERILKEEQEKREKEEQAEKEKVKQEEYRQLEILQKQMEKNNSLQKVSAYCRPDARRGGNGKCLVEKVKVLNSEGTEIQILETGKEYVIEITLNNYKHLKDVVVAIGFTREDGTYCYGSFVDVSNKKDKLNGTPIKFKFTNMFLKGKYFLDLFVQSVEKEVYDEIICLQLLEVKEMKTKQRGIFSMENEWE